MTNFDDRLELDTQTKHFLNVYKWANEKIAEYQAIATSARSALEKAIGEHELATVEGKAAISWIHYKANVLDIKALKTALPEVAAAFTKTTERRRFTLIDDEDDDGVVTL